MDRNYQDRKWWAFFWIWITAIMLCIIGNHASKCIDWWIEIKQNCCWYSSSWLAYFEVLVWYNGPLGLGPLSHAVKKHRSYTYFFLLILWNNNLFFSLFLIGELFRYYQKIAAVQNFLTANISNAILKPVKQMLYKKLDMIETWGCQVSFKHTSPGK